MQPQQQLYVTDAPPTVDPSLAAKLEQSSTVGSVGSWKWGTGYAEAIVDQANNLPKIDIPHAINIHPYHSKLVDRTQDRPDYSKLKAAIEGITYGSLASHNLYGKGESLGLVNASDFVSAVFNTALMRGASLGPSMMRWDLPGTPFFHYTFFPATRMVARKTQVLCYACFYSSMPPQPNSNLILQDAEWKSYGGVNIDVGPFFGTNADLMIKSAIHLTKPASGSYIWVRPIVPDELLSQVHEYMGFKVGGASFGAAMQLVVLGAPSILYTGAGKFLSISDSGTASVVAAGVYHDAADTEVQYKVLAPGEHPVAAGTDVVEPIDKVVLKSIFAIAAQVPLIVPSRDMYGAPMTTEIAKFQNSVRQMEIYIANRFYTKLQQQALIPIGNKILGCGNDINDFVQLGALMQARWNGEQLFQDQAPYISDVSNAERQRALASRQMAQRAASKKNRDELIAATGEQAKWKTLSMEEQDALLKKARAQRKADEPARRKARQDARAPAVAKRKLAKAAASAKAKAQGATKGGAKKILLAGKYKESLQRDRIAKLHKALRQQQQFHRMASKKQSDLRDKNLDYMRRTHLNPAAFGYTKPNPRGPTRSTTMPASGVNMSQSASASQSPIPKPRKTRSVPHGAEDLDRDDDDDDDDVNVAPDDDQSGRLRRDVSYDETGRPAHF